MGLSGLRTFYAPCLIKLYLGFPQGRCYGCGCLMQCINPLALGFVKPDKYVTKKKHKQLDKVMECKTHGFA